MAAVRLNSDIISFGERQVKLPLAPGKRYTGLVLLFSCVTGEPLAIFPDGVLQRMRVGGASALGVKYLARPEAASVGLIGASCRPSGSPRTCCRRRIHGNGATPQAVYVTRYARWCGRGRPHEDFVYPD